jgi:hypothetical protein
MEGFEFRIYGLRFLVEDSSSKGMPLAEMTFALSFRPKGEI